MDHYTSLPFHKHCKQCDQSKPLDAFAPAKRGKYGREAECRDCKNARKRRYNAENPDKIRAQNANLTEAQREAKRAREKRNYWTDGRQKRRERYQANREKHLIYMSKWRIAHPEYNRNYCRKHPRRYNREYSREYYRANLASFKRRSAAWLKARPEYNQERYRADPEKFKQRNRDWSKANPDQVRAKNHRRRTRIAGNGGYFTAKDVANMRYIQGGKCAYCGRLGQRLHIEHIIPVVRGGPSDPFNLCLACRRCNLNKGSKLLSEWTVRWYLLS